VRRAVRTASLALCAAALLSLPAPASAVELDDRTSRLDASAAETERLAAELEQAAGRDGGLRLQLDRLAGEVEDARARVRARARQAYLATAQPAPLPRLVTALAAPDLRAHADAELARRGARAAVRAEQSLADAVVAQSEAAQELQRSAEAHRAGLRAAAERALAAQEEAREVLAAAEARLVVERAAATARRRAAEREAPVVALVEAAGSGYPSGWTPSGTVLRGVASWYGPGFVGKPTASGAPYDPERLTCAHKTLPLGTVVRVSREGRAISCLVNDRGPYVGRRIIDLSRAGSRALGFDGVAPVVVEVLVPGA
jgi:rare lipoprotein A (peptidoglycan hydrolase)